MPRRATSAGLIGDGPGPYNASLVLEAAMPEPHRRVGLMRLSPTTMAETSASIWRWQSRANAARSSSPFSSKGVGRSGM